MFGRVSPSEYDLRFPVGPFPVRVHPFFWLVSALMGWNAREPAVMLLWVLAVFVSILVHELGHALALRRFGYDSEVVLHQFGGYADFFPDYLYTPRRDIVVSLAGPVAGFLLAGVIWGLIRIPGTLELIHSLPDRQFRFISLLISFLLHINTWWGVMNLLPVYPLDGGRVCQSLLRLSGVLQPHRKTYQVSFVVAAGVAIWMLTLERQYTALMFGYLAFENFQSLQQERW